MIFVTVGTHEQQFDRLIRAVDSLKGIQDEVIVQSGFSTYEPQRCTWSRMLPYDQMRRHVEQARIVITHGGPASFMMPLQMGKIPIVVPRQARFGEHVNDHQVEFVKEFSQRTGRILPVYEIDILEEVVLRYEETAIDSTSRMHSNNEEFNRNLERIILELLEKC